MAQVHASYMEHTGNTDASVYAIKGEVYNGEHTLPAAALQCIELYCK